MNQIRANEHEIIIIIILYIKLNRTLNPLSKIF